MKDLKGGRQRKALGTNCFILKLSVIIQCLAGEGRRNYSNPSINLLFLDRSEALYLEAEQLSPVLNELFIATKSFLP